MRALPIIIIGVVLIVLFQLISGIGTGPAENEVHVTSESSDSERFDDRAVDTLDRPESVTGRMEPERVSARTALTTEASDTEPSEAPARVRGRLVDGLGRVVADANVTLTRQSFLGTRDSDPVDSTLSSSRGEFELSCAASDRGGSMVLTVRARGMARLRQELEMTAGGELDLGDLLLDFGVILAGRVTDESGTPIAGAEIRSEPDRDVGWRIRGLSRHPLVAETDSAGRFEIFDQPVGPWVLLAGHPDLQDLRMEGETAGRNDHQADLEFVMSRGERIEGRITGASREDLEGVRVVAWPYVGEDMFGLPRASTDSEAPGPRFASVTPDGGFSIGGARPGTTYTLYGGREGDGLFGPEAITENGTAKAGDRDVVLPWSQGATVTFRVVDGVTGEALEEFGVNSGISFPTPLSDPSIGPRSFFPDGLVQIDGIRPTETESQLQVQVLAPGFEPWNRKDIEVLVGETIDLGTISLERAPRLDVLVLDEQGDAPVADARVKLVVVEEENRGGLQMASIGMSVGLGSRSPRGPEVPSTHRGRTDRDGRVMVSTFPGETARVHVEAAGFPPFQGEAIEFGEGDEEVTVRLVAGSTALVTVLDRAGNPVQGLTVEHSRPNGETRSDGNVRCDGNGVARFEDLEEGTHYFRISEDVVRSGLVMVMSTNAGKPQGEGWVELAVGGEGEHELELVLAPRSILEGVITEAGQPLAGAEISLTEAGGMGMNFMLPGMGGGKSTRTNSSGAYTFEDVRTGKYDMTVRHRSRAMPTEADVDLVEGENEKDLDLPLNFVRGRVLDSAGDPVVGAEVRVTRVQEAGRSQVRMVMVATSSGGAGPAMTISNGPEDDGLTARTDEEGAYELSGLPIGIELQVDARETEHSPGRSEPFELSAGEDAEDVDVVLVVGGRALIRADISELESLYIVHARFTGSGAGSVEPKVTTIDGTGEGTMEGLRPGTWSFELRPAGLPGEVPMDMPDPVSVEIVGGEESLVHF